MSAQCLARLERVDLRSVWGKEAGDFTPWLAQPENLSLIGEAIRMELELEAQETEVGPFRADILCKNTLDGGWVLIENQLERTDHTHLGQLLTYAAGLDAATIVWVASRFTEEHRAALDWLNQITDDRFTFFGLEIELWRIGDSPVAPKFNVVSSPNDWARTIQNSASKNGSLPEGKQAQLDFWTAFREYMRQMRSPVRCSKPAPQSWMTHPVGRTGFYLASVASTWDSENKVYNPEIRAEMVIQAADSKKYFALLEAKKSEVEGEFGQALIWYDAPSAKVCRIYLRRPADFRNASQWPEQHEWLRANLEKLHKVFAHRVRQLDVSKVAAALEIEQ